MKLLALIIPSLLFVPLARSQQPPRAAIRKFVEDVSIGPKATLRRWAAPPAVSIYNYTQAPEASIVCIDVIDNINASLATVPFQLSKMAPKSAAAQLRIVICERKDFIATVKNHNVTPVGTRTWGWWKWWDDSDCITRAIIILSREQGNTDSFSIEAHTALMFALGIAQTSEVPVTSFLARCPEQPETLPELDKRLLPFFYQHCKPGFKTFEVRRAFDQFWR